MNHSDFDYLLGMKYIALFLCPLLALGACKKETNRPMMRIVSPLNNQVFASGETVYIRGTISDDTQIHDLHMTITNTSTGTQMMHLDEHLDTQLYTLDQSFIAQAGNTYTIKIEADDHASNTTGIQLVVSAQ